MKKIISLFLILFMLSYVGSVVIFDSNHKINQLYFPVNNKIFFPIENINLFFVSMIGIFGLFYLPVVCLYFLN